MYFKRLICTGMACLTSFCMCTTALAAPEAVPDIDTVAVQSDEEGTAVGYYTYQLQSDGTAVCTGPAQANAPRTLEIPSSITIDDQSFAVTTIASGAFRSTSINNPSKIKSVTLPDGLRTIGDAAFCGLTSITQIVLPDSITEMGTFAFADCTSLESVRIPGSLENIPGSAFCRCSHLTNVTFEDGLKSIGLSAFTECPEIAEINLPATLQNIAPGAFASSANPFVVNFAGSPAQWDHAAKSAANWYRGSGSAHVICQIPEELIVEKDLEYAPDAEEWHATVKLNMEGLGQEWTAELQQQRRSLSVWTSRSVEDVHTFTIPLNSTEGDEPKAKIFVQNTQSGSDVRITAEKEILFRVGWSPQNWRKWITVSSQEVRSGEQIEITLSPKDGYVEAEILGHEGLSLDGAPVVLSSTGADGHPRSATIKATVTGKPGDAVPIVVSGQFRHELGHGIYRAVLDPVIIADEPEEMPSPDKSDDGGKQDTDSTKEDPDPTQKPDEDNDNDQQVTSPSDSKDAEPSAVPSNDAQASPSRIPQEDEAGSSEQPGSDAPKSPAPSPSVSPGQSNDLHDDNAVKTPEPSESVSPEPSGSLIHKPKEDRDDGDNEPGEEAPPELTGILPPLKDDSLLLYGFQNKEAYLAGSLDDDGTPLIDVRHARNSFELTDGLTVEIVDHDGQTVPDDKPLATGYEAVFRVSSGEVIARVPIVIMGDVCGTGSMMLTQVVRTAKSFTGQSRLIGCYLQAGDFDRNQKVDLTDVVKEAKLFKSRIESRSAGTEAGGR